MKADKQKTLYLLDCTSKLERKLLVDWILRDSMTNDFQYIEIQSSRRRRRKIQSSRLETALQSASDTKLVPLRIAWLPATREHGNTVSIYDVLMLSDPRDPGILRQKWIRHFHPDRSHIIVAASASIGEMAARWKNINSERYDPSLFTEFVTRQAWLALERAERALRGARYKVPRFVHEEISAKQDFHMGIVKLKQETGRNEKSLKKTGKYYLKEIAANHSPFLIDLLHRLIGLIYRRGYTAIHYSAEHLKNIYANAQRHPIVFLPTHKSNLDHLLMQYLLHENNFPPNHTAGGININFFPVGMLLRRTGVFFIRRTFKDNPLYKFVLRLYIDYLIEKRFAFEWYIEGGRSRTGKLLPPRLGMLSYVIDSYQRGKCEDIIFVPVSIAYDQISDVSSYVAEQRGAKKEKESFGWMMRTLRSFRHRYGSIHIRFGDTLSLAKSIAKGASADEHSIAVQKIAFELAVRVNRVTPITATALVSLVFLGEDDRAMTLSELGESLNDIAYYVQQRSLPTTDNQVIHTPSALQRALEALVDTGVVTHYQEGQESLYGITPGQHLTAAYYRNTVVHFFINGAIVELALIAAYQDQKNRLKIFWDEALQIRDLLKFEFFFPEKDIFKTEIRQELERHISDWESLIEDSSNNTKDILLKIRPYMAHRALRPFLEAYMVVADALALWGNKPYQEVDFLASALALGRQYLLQRRLHRAESVSKTLFASAASLAANRGLTSQSSDSSARRQEFANYLHLVLRRIDAIDALQAGRSAGVL